MHQGGGYHVSASNSLSHITKKLRWGTLRGITKFRVSKNFMHQGGGYHVSGSKSLSHITKKFRWGTLQCFRNFRVSQIFMRTRGISPFLIENLLSHSTENLRNGTLLYFTNFQVWKNLWIRWGGRGRGRGRGRWKGEEWVSITIFCQKFFVSQCRNISEANTSVFQKISHIAKFYA